MVKARDSCQPDQGLEPVTENEDPEEGTAKPGVKAFVPIKRSGGKRRKVDEMSENLVKMVNKFIEQDSTKDILSYMQNEKEKKREAHLELVKEENKQFMAMMQMKAMRQHV